MLGTDGGYVSFVDAHYYPFFFFGNTGGSNPTDQQVLRALFQIPSLYGQIRSELNAYDPKAGVVVGETGVSNNETTTVCTPVGALFGTLRTWSYSAGDQNATNSAIVTGATSAASVANGVTLPAESMTILETS